MYFRTFYGVPDSVRSPDGRPVNAVRGFLDAVASLVERYSPTHLTAVFDADWRPGFRVAALPSYKAHRVADDGDSEVVPDDLLPQVGIITELLDAMGICRTELVGYEADDVIATLASNSPIPVDIVTGDRDLFQLVDDRRGIRVLYTVKGFARLSEIDEAAVLERYAVPARLYADFAVLRGDPSDGLPGVSGVGDKSAAIVVNAVGTIEDVLVALDDPGSELPFRAKLKKSRDYLAVAPSVVRVHRTLPVTVDDELSAPSAEQLRVAEGLAAEHGLEGAVQRLADVLSRFGTG